MGKFLKFILDFIIMNIGSILMALGTSLFLLPNKLSNGGFSGIATIIYYFFDIEMSKTIILLNIPFFIVGYLKVGKSFIFKTIYSTIVFSKTIDLFTSFINIKMDLFLSSVYGGILIGLGCALNYKVNSSTGGSDLIAHLIRSYTERVKTGEVIVYVDFLVVFLNLIVFKDLQIGLYSWICIFIVGKVIDIVFEGVNFCKVVYIISDKYNEIGKCIINNLDRGATGIYGRGLYLSRNKEIIMCVVKGTDVIKVKEIAKKIDKNAFIIVESAREVYGLGFKT